MLFLLVYGVRTLALAGVRRMVTERPDRAGFWSRQGIQLIAAIVLLLGIASIWIDRGTNLTTGLGPHQRRAGLCPSTGGDRGRRVLRDPARRHLQRR